MYITYTHIYIHTGTYIQICMHAYIHAHKYTQSYRQTVKQTGIDIQ